MMELSWPPKILNPNNEKQARWFHGAKASAKKKHKAECALIASTMKPTDSFEVIMHPPCKRRRDIQNIIAAMKWGIDGIAEQWGIDDSKMKIHWPTEFAEPVKGGKIIIKKI